MKQLLIRRLIQSIPTLIGASILVFLVFTLAPGDFVTQMSADANMTQERLDEIRALHGLDQPLYKQYLTWMGNLLTGNFGESVLHRQPVTSVINTFMWNSFLIAIIVLVLQWIIASIVGIMAALRQYSIYDSAVTLIVFMAMSFPSFFWDCLC